jgi:hypothetical protein
MVGLIAFGSPDRLVISPKVYASKFIITYKIFVTVTNPATETTSMGLLADAQAVKFFAAPFTKFTLT